MIQENVVDANLENFLKCDLGQNKNRVDVADEDLSTDEDQDDKKVSEKTKQAIASLISRCAVNSEVNAARIMTILSRIEKMNENQAKSYLKALKMAETTFMSDELIDTIIQLSAQLTVHPNRYDIYNRIIIDKHVKRSFTAMVGDLFDVIGNASGVIVFILYSLLSWYNVGPEKTNNAKTTVPLDGTGQIANGEDNITNKIA